MNRSTIKSILAFATFLILIQPLTAQDESANRYRMWNVGGTKHVAKFERMDKEHATFRTIDDEEIVIELARLSVADRESCAKLTEHFEALKKGASGRIRALETSSIQASIILAKMEEALTKKPLKEEDKKFLESRIAFYRPLAATDSVLVAKKFVSRSLIQYNRKLSQKLIVSWRTDSIKLKDPSAKIGKLKQAAKVDVVANEAPILLGLYYTFWERKYDEADRFFTNAIKRHSTYKELYGESEITNHIIALNNHAASLIRKNDTKRASQFLQTAFRVNGTVDLGVYWNLMRITRLITTRSGLGIKVSIAVGKTLVKLQEESELNPPKPTDGKSRITRLKGWAYRIPVPLGSVEYDDLSFLIRHRNYAKSVDRMIEDLACIDCDGSGVFSRGNRRDKCPMCNRGIIRR